eukprot:CAMPEP_0206459018 /NCGR_PEP_ID=MMETSP0324_2-20121206/23926_1 /ASSEMBLY_ACC=CAM_ASM_000836 /TAXON_ID=2866 /ORGANISM="Crypthecodinium cohnii, Strain Seligo" /LENGTH=649 /DNA_ID=CAMNT_0053930489 /DNA_START=171 /DNA_END=2117 /DNA_ORIENTATION=+
MAATYESMSSPDMYGSEEPAVRAWEWVYDDEMAERDVQEAAARAEVTNRHWETTVQNASKITRHVSSQLVDVDLPSPSRSVVASSSESPSHVRRRLNYMASHMTNNQDRTVRFYKNRTRNLEHHLEAREHFLSDLRSANARCVAKQMELVEIQRRRAFNNAQRRSEQQKVLREVQKEKQRVWETYYQQQHSLMGSRQGSKSDAHTSIGSISSSASLPQLHGMKAESDVIQTLQASHARYADELERWRHFVAENERRTDLQWKKVLHGGRKEDFLGGGEVEHRPSKEKTRSLFKQAILGRNLLLAKDGQGVGCSDAIKESEEEDEAMVVDERPPLMLANQNSAEFASRWRMRRQKTREFQDECDQNRVEMGEQNEDRLQQARERIAEHNRTIVDKFRSQAQDWRDKCDAAAARRASEQEANTDDYNRKQAACVRRIKAEADRMQAIRQQREKERLIKVAKCQEVSRAAEQAKVESALKQLEKIDVALVERASIQKMEADSRRVKDNREERSNNARKKKAAVVEEIARKINQEILEREQRNEATLAKLRLSVLDKERERHQKVKAEREGKAAASSSSGDFDGAGALPPLYGSMSLPILFKPGSPAPICPIRKVEKSDFDIESEPESDSDEEEKSRKAKKEFLDELEGSCGA